MSETVAHLAQSAEESRQPLALNLLCGLYFKEESNHEKI